MKVHLSVRSSLVAIAVAAVLGVTAACGSGGSGGSGSKAAAPGVTDSQVKLGLVLPQTGALSTSVALGVDVGAKARFALENEQGGVNGRKLTLVTEDDQSSPTTVLSAAQKLVQQEGVFAVMEESAVFSSAYRYLQQQNVPVLSGRSIDGAEWGDPSVSNMIEARGATSPTAPPPTGFVKLFKAAGATKLALLAYGNSPAGAAVVDAVKNGAEAAGLQVVYVNKALPLPVTGLSALALAIKNSGADQIYTPLATADQIAIFNAAKAQGVNIKSLVISQVYGKTLIQDPATAAAVNGAVLSLSYDVTGPKGQAVVDAVHKYTSYQGVPTAGVFYGWVMADLAIAGLQKAHFGTTVGTLFEHEGQPYSPDFAAVARAFGVEGVRVERAEDFRPALEKAIAAGKPCVIDVYMKNNPVPTAGHWNIMDIYSPGEHVHHMAV